jgi:Tol biopolymer transport system component
LLIVPALAVACDTILSGVSVACVRFSPDGTRIAYTAGGHLYMLDDPQTPLIEADWVSWSPDGERLVVERGGDLWFYEIGSGALQQLTDTPAVQENDPDWSSDGDKIAYGLNTPWPGKLMVYSISAGQHVEVFENVELTGEVRRPHWSPDGSRVLADLEGLVSSAVARVQGPIATIIEYPSGSPSPIPGSVGQWPHHARWHPSGLWLMLATISQGQFYSILGVRVTDGETVELRYNGNFGIATLDWAPSGSQWIFSSGGGGGYLELCDSPPVAIEPTTWGAIKASFNQ